ncbi:hypothetical protein PoB_001559200 [Plakobranchus ocellatus]|uniref:Ig-like domain-containing protein n=1 Tax=Plakobranchus ocellatus TaxID=259542 RepID=A0AAV3Z1M0_9GAST|nr:hypothetical protein PoB_001559200 [Plakobranchus ocellatus]
MNVPGLLGGVVWSLLLLYSVKAEDDPAPPAITGFTFGRLDEEDFMTSAVRGDGATPTLRCSALSDTNPMSINIKRERTGEKIAEVMGGNLSLTFQPLQCDDTDVYICSAVNEAGKTSVTIELYVLCPPQLLTEDIDYDLDSPFLRGSVGKDLTLQIEVQSFPPPSSLSLTTINTRGLVAFTDLINNVDEGGSQEDEHGQARYMFDYVPAVEPYGSVLLTIKNLMDEDMGKMYNLLVDNGQEEVLEYKFMITNETPSSSEPSTLNIPALILGLLLLLVCFTIAFVVGYIVCKRDREPGGRYVDSKVEQRQRNASRGDSTRNDATTTPTSTVSADIHVFENVVYGTNKRSTTNSLGHVQQQRPSSRQHPSRDERFSRASQPQPRQTRSATITSEDDDCNVYSEAASIVVDRSNGANTAMGMEEEDTELYVYTSMPRNTSVQIDAEENRKQLSHLINKMPTSNAGEGSEEQPYSKVNKTRQPPANREPFAADDDGGDEIYDVPPSPSDMMREAELKIARGEREKEFVVPEDGERRLSVGSDVKMTIDEYCNDNGDGDDDYDDGGGGDDSGGGEDDDDDDDDDDGDDDD